MTDESNLKSKQHFAVQIDGAHLESLLKGHGIRIETDEFVANIRAEDITSHDYQHIALTAINRFDP